MQHVKRSECKSSPPRAGVPQVRKRLPCLNTHQSARAHPGPMVQQTNRTRRRHAPRYTYQPPLHRAEAPPGTPHVQLHGGGSFPCSLSMLVPGQRTHNALQQAQNTNRLNMIVDKSSKFRLKMNLGNTQRLVVAAACATCTPS